MHRVGTPGLGDDAGFRAQRRTLRRMGLSAQRGAVLLYAQFALRQQSQRKAPSGGTASIYSSSNFSISFPAREGSVGHIGGVHPMGMPGIAMDRRLDDHGLGRTHVSHEYWQTTISAVSMVFHCTTQSIVPFRLT
jgi:hypothetical protein